MKFRHLNLLILSLLWSVFSAFCEPKQVEGTGIASGSGDQAREEAVSKALRNALERSIGVMVSSESLVKNFQLIQDSIYSNVQGYVKDYQITEDNKGEGGVTRVKVLATVEESKLENDLKGIRVILDAKGNPRTMLMLVETIDGDPSPFISDQIEKFFVEKTFPLIDRSQMEVIKSRDAEDLEKDPAKAKALGNRFGAELILTGFAQTRMASQREAYGVPVYNYTGSLSLKAINADTGEILAIMNENAAAYGGNQKEASIKALSQVWESGREDFFATLMEKWRSSVLNSTEMTLIVSRCVPEARAGIIEKLKSVDGIKRLTEKSYKDGVCEFSADVDGTYANSLDQKVAEILPQLVLTGKTANRLDFEVQQ